MKNRTAFLIFFLLIGLFANAQSFTDHTPLENNPNTDQSLASAIKTRYQKDVALLSGSNKKYIAEIYKERYEYLNERFKTKEIITNETAQLYLQKIVEEILKKNPSLPDANSLRIYFSRAWWANASSMGEGTILFNIGLFYRLQNEAQAAFVICHELAHYYLDHGNNNIARYVQTVYSDEFQKQLKEISKSEYNKNTQLEKMALTLGFKNRRHSREYEKAADSMAIILMTNTGFDLNEAISCLEILDSSDKEKYYTPLKLDQTFHFAAYPFKKRWLESNTLSFVDTKEEKEKNKTLADSLKTHPDCSVRIEVLKEMIGRINKPAGKKFLADEKRFAELHQLFDYEILDYLFTSDRISLCLYTALQMHHADTNNAYVTGMIGKCLNKIYTAQKAHELGKVTDLPSPSFDEEYNSLLRLIQNVRLTELASINYYFLEANIEKAKKSEEFIAAVILNKELSGKPEEKSRWQEYYIMNFPKRKYQF
jgi:Zn-dependent protease with chaperone function